MTGVWVMGRELGHYVLEVKAGPGREDVGTWVEYYDLDGVEIGRYGEVMIAFATTWKDVAEVIRKGEQLLGLDRDPVRNVSPMVDLS